MRKKRVISSALAVLMTGSLLCPAAQAAKPVVDEAYYGVLDYYGALQEGSVVKSYYTNGNTILHDIGTYDSVENLTDRTEPVISGENITFDFGEEAPRNFYFQGKTAQPFRDMPFTISVSYKMNGVETDAEDMAGQTGMAEITLDVLPNQSASEYQKNNFVLEAMTVLQDTDTLSVEAEGGQVQKVGNSDMVLYAVLPGEEQHFTLRVGTEDFSFAGFTFLVQPATLAQLDMVSDLREAKGEMEDSYHAVTDALNEILDSVEGMDSKLRNTADGLDQLNAARATLSAGKQEAYDEADVALASMTDLSASLAPVVEHLKTAKTAIHETADQLGILSETMATLNPDVLQLKSTLETLETDLDKLNRMLKNTQTDAAAISDALGDLEGDLDTLESDLSRVEKDTSALSSDLGDLKGINIEDLEIKIQGMTPAQVREYHEQAVEYFSLYTAYLEEGGTGSFVEFLIANGADPADAQKMSYLYYGWKEIEPQIEEAETYNTLIQKTGKTLDKTWDSVKIIADTSADLLDSLSLLMKHTNEEDGLLENSRELLEDTRSLLDTVSGYDTTPLYNDSTALLQTTERILTTADQVLTQSKELSDTILKYEPDVQSGLEDAVTQVNAGVKLLDDVNRLASTMENLMKSADPDLDQGMQEALSGTSDSLLQMANGLKNTPTIRKANEKVEKLVEDKWKEYTGEKNNALNMDSKAEKVSLTSEKNQSPNTLQIVLRTQEIKVPEDPKDGTASDPVVKTTFWQRVGQMFKDIAGIFTG